MSQNTRETPPLLMKIGLTVIGLTSVYGIARLAEQSAALTRLSFSGWLACVNGFALNVGALVCVEAAWHYRRWGAIGLFVSVPLSIILGTVSMVVLMRPGTSVTDVHWVPLLAVVFVVRILPLMPLALYWRRLK